MPDSDSKIIFDAAAFRAQCPAYESEQKYPDDLLSDYWDMATGIVSDENYGAVRNFKRRMALNWMTAHIIEVSAKAARGKAGGFVTASTVDKVSVTRLAPPAADQFEWWLQQTGYGQSLYALLDVHSVGGFSIGGSPETAAFRRVGGKFW